MTMVQYENAAKQKQRCCPLCGYEKSEVVFTHARLANIKRTYASRESVEKLITSLNTNLCMNCGMLYRMPLMTANELSQYYTDSYYETYNDSLKTQKEQSRTEELQLWKEKYKRYFRFLAKNKICLTGRRVLDVGCGTGCFLSVAKENGAGECLGIEPSRQCYERFKNSEEYGFRVLNRSISDISPEKIGMFDLLVCIGVLEHLSEPLSDLRICRSLMTDDAYMYIYSHNEAPNLFTDLRKRISLVHQLYFTKRTVQLLFRKVGLRIIKLETRSTDMHILAKKCEPINLEHSLNRTQYRLLKTQYLIYKIIPPFYFSIASWLYGKYLALRDRLLYSTK
jgi:2-polyprenyl-3-methyl-5-hydroxy-6-metoxy-1,4-benzoquinol methylase